MLVRDPSGALVTNAEITIASAAGGTPLSNVADLPPGKYHVSVSRTGFESTSVEIEVKPGQAFTLTVSPKIAAQQTSVQVGGKISSLANSDPNYRALRGGRPAGALHVENLELNRDIGKFTFTGEFSFLPPVLGRTVMAVFIGDGSFHLAPHLPLETNHLKLITGSTEVDEQFQSIPCTGSKKFDNDIGR